MPDALTLVLLVSLQVAGFGAFWWQFRATGKALAEQEARLLVVEAQALSLLSRTDRRMIGNEAAMIEEWRKAADEAPEGSPRREAYLNRLRELEAL